jgi:drug/metabolite transporter (DMT)-like permease
MSGESISNSSREGWLSGLLGVLIFSGSLPATRIAVAGFSPLFLTSARAVIAALLGAVLLLALPQERPTRTEVIPLIIVALGCVVGFPLFTALALQHITSAHSIVFIGLLPLATAAFGVVRGGEQPKPLFWLFSCLGSAAVIVFALGRGGTFSLAGDLYMLAAILVCGLGYAEGARLSGHLGGWQVISWALIISSPVMVVLALTAWPADITGISAGPWLGLGYVAVFSMLVGFIFWYHGLARGGTASVGQLQLLQPFFGFLLASFMLGEEVTAMMFITTVAVIGCVFLARRFAR